MTWVRWIRNVPARIRTATGRKRVRHLRIKGSPELKYGVQCTYFASEDQGVKLLQRHDRLAERLGVGGFQYYLAYLVLSVKEIL
jgi:hypothetical protein